MAGYVNKAKDVYNSELFKRMKYLSSKTGALGHNLSGDSKRVVIFRDDA